MKLVGSIFLDPPEITGRTNQEMVSILATELTVVESALKMGYVKAGEVNLESRVEQLEKSIKHYEGKR